MEIENGLSVDVEEWFQVGAFERVIGRGQQTLRMGADLRRPLRHADRGRHRDIVADTSNRVLLTCGQHAVRHHRPFVQRRRRQYDAEFVAAGPRQQIAGPQLRLRHQAEVLKTGIAGGMTVGIVDLLEAVEVNYEKSEGPAAPLRHRACVFQTQQQLPPVGDARQIVHQREIGDLVAQPVDRHQQEAEIPGHRQKYEDDQQGRLQRIEFNEGYATANVEECADRPDCADRNHQPPDDTGELCARIDPAILAGQQQAQRHTDRYCLPRRIYENAHRHIVAHIEKERESERAQSDRRRGQQPGHPALIEALNSHRTKADRENQSAATDQQWQHGIRDAAQHRDACKERSEERSRGPVSRRRERRVTSDDIGPDKTQRHEVDDEHDP